MTTGNDVMSVCHRTRRRSYRLLCGIVAAAMLTLPGRADAQVNYEVLRGFPAVVESTNSLLEASDGNFYGTSQYGGDFFSGTFFRMTHAGVVTILYSFNGHDDGSPQDGSVLEASDHSFYGIVHGGVYGGGAVFRITADGAFTTVHAFAEGLDDGYSPSSLILGSDGHFYGTTSYGGSDALGGGTAFRMTPAGAVTIIRRFDTAAPEGGSPGQLLQASDGQLYGLTTSAPAAPIGIAFRMRLDGNLTVLHRFTSEEGYVSRLIQASDGNFYGTTWSSVLRMSIGGTVTTLCTPFLQADNPLTLVEGDDGSLYVTTYGFYNDTGNDRPGALFKVAGITCSRLHTFTVAEGLHPRVLIRSNEGHLYGATDPGRAEGGSIFSVDVNGVVSVRHAFPYTANSPVIQASDGNFYGTTRSGGALGRGTIYRVTPAGDYAEIYSFTGGPDGGLPTGGLIEARPGLLYGTTSRSDTNGAGTIFQVTLDGRFTVLHGFRGDAAEGGAPQTGLIDGGDGHFYGTTSSWSTANGGTVYRLSPDGLVTVLHVFNRTIDGAEPGRLSRGADGKLYVAATTNGGDSSDATVFSVARDGTVTPLHTFVGEGGVASSLVETREGSLYGISSRGMMFTIDPSGGFSLVAQIADVPSGPLVQARDGRLYGTRWNAIVAFTLSGGSSVLQIIPSRVYLHGGLIQGLDGDLYGTTDVDDRWVGEVFHFSPLPGMPIDVAAAQRIAGAVRLTWDVVANATSYQIRRRDASGAEVLLASGVATASFLDTTAIRGQRYSYIVTAVNALGESSRSSAVPITAGVAAAGDFTGDGTPELTVFRPADGTWYGLDVTTDQTTGIQWGSSGDLPAPGDYDGDGTIDITIYRPTTGTWWVLQSSTGFTTYRRFDWGLTGDVPVPADYDGDGITDVAIYRPTTGMWWVLQSSSGFTRYTNFHWGETGDIPVPRDYDGDGKADFAVFRPGDYIRQQASWWLFLSATNTVRLAPLYNPGGRLVPVPADYDGDGKADLAVYDPVFGYWSVTSSQADADSISRSWGNAGDVPVPADYDGDGKTDIAIYRPSTGEWWILASVSGQAATYQWGVSGDVAVLKRP